MKTSFFLPYNKKLTDRARELRRNMTQAEQKIWDEFLKHLPLRILKQRPIDNYIADFYCASLKLVIEIDGAIHNNDEQIGYDEVRTKIFEGYGLRVIRFTNDEILNNFEIVCSSLSEILIPPDPP